MRIHKIQDEWVDLDHILSISEPSLSRGCCVHLNDHPYASFDIRLSFREDIVTYKASIPLDAEDIRLGGIKLDEYKKTTKWWLFLPNINADLSRQSYQHALHLFTHNVYRPLFNKWQE